ncbi:MAG: hypothetical protein QME66_04230 [Candidatus Eisenbacteria bacterium]|nr:hypothetical protein [Candidatus Eisenbacteria bacterium]
MTNDTAKEQAQVQLEAIQGLLAAYDQAKESGTVDHDGETLTVDQFEERVHETPLCVEVRGGWHIPGAENKDSEYTILLCTGGPAVRIIGDLSDEPETARLEYQDWGTEWTDYHLTKEQEEQVIDYARFFNYEDTQ